MTTFQCVGRLGALLVLVAATMAAQTSASNWDAVKALATGAPVRITTGSNTVRAKIDRITGDTLMVTSAKGQETIDRQQVSAVSVQKPSRRKRNTLIGLGVGTGVGLGIGIAARSRPNQLEIIPNSALAAIFTVTGALIGTIVGVVIPSGGWHEIYRK